MRNLIDFSVTLQTYHTVLFRPWVEMFKIYFESTHCKFFLFRSGDTISKYGMDVSQKY